MPAGNKLLPSLGYIRRSRLSVVLLNPKSGQDKHKPPEDVTAKDILPYFAKRVFINIDIYRQQLTFLF